MKKLYTLMMMAMTGVMVAGLTSCENDEYIARTLEGTWKGNMYVSSEWDGRYYDATATEITFLKDPYTYSSGTGYWVDYYSNAPWDYVANHIEWRVDYGTIYVYFVEERTSMEIRDYRLNANRFTGYIYDGGNNVDFELYNVSRPYYDNYRWGYDSWGYYYSRTRSADGASIAPATTPKRIIRSTK